MYTISIQTYKSFADIYFEYNFSKNIYQWWAIGGSRARSGPISDFLTQTRTQKLNKRYNFEIA
jgi:hypothetical protein